MNTNIVEELNELSVNELTDLETRLKITPDMRIHMSKNPIYKLEQKVYAQVSSNKPKGFWYGFGDEWIDWVEMQMPEWRGDYIYKVDINGSNMLLIKDYLGIKEFTDEYLSKEQVYPGATYFVDWDRVALKYDGIEINPYIGEARLEFEWYYFWDVATGCIWNLSKVEIELI